MNKLMTTTAALLVAATAACGGSDADQAQNSEATSAPEATRAGAANPFADAEMSMNRDMMAAVGANAADNWVRKMIPHHRGAVEMARIVLQNNPTADVAKMAQQTIDKQTKEAEDLEKMVKQGAPDQQSAALYEPSMKQMQQEMMAATGADASETWMRKMIAHHRGAIAMSEVVLKQNPPADVRRKAEKTKSDQQKEIAMLERMLRGEPMDEAGQASGDSPTASVAGPSPASGRAPAPRPSPSPSARASDAMAGQNMSNMSNMNMSSTSSSQR